VRTSAANLPLTGHRGGSKCYTGPVTSDGMVVSSLPLRRGTPNTVGFLQTSTSMTLTGRGPSTHSGAVSAVPLNDRLRGAIIGVAVARAVHLRGATRPVEQRMDDHAVAAGAH